MLAELTIATTQVAASPVNNPFLPDLQIFADLNDDAFIQSVEEPIHSVATKKARKVVPINQFVDLVAHCPGSESQNLTDRIVSNALKQHFCNELFDLLGGFVC